MSQPYYPPAGYPPPPPQPQPQPRRKRRWFLKTVLVILALVVILGVIAVATRQPTRAPVTGDVKEAGTLSAFDLQEGDCYNTEEKPPAPGTSQPISSVEAVPCTSPHTDQVIAKISYVGENYYDVVGSKANDDCDAQYQQKLDPEVFDDPTLSRGTLAPADVLSWGKNSAVACIVFSSAPISRSLLV